MNFVPFFPKCIKILFMATPENPQIPSPDGPEPNSGHNDFARHLKRFFANDEDRAQRAVDRYLRKHKGEEVDYATMFEELTSSKGKQKSHWSGKPEGTHKERRLAKRPRIHRNGKR